MSEGITNLRCHQYQLSRSKVKVKMPTTRPIRLIKPAKMHYHLKLIQHLTSTGSFSVIGNLLIKNTNIAYSSQGQRLRSNVTEM